MTDQQLREQYPWIDWDEPILIHGPGGITRFACRLCIAQHGLKGEEIAQLPQSKEEVKAHIVQEHTP